MVVIDRPLRVIGVYRQHEVGIGRIIVRIIRQIGFDDGRIIAHGLVVLVGHSRPIDNGLCVGAHHCTVLIHQQREDILSLRQRHREPSVAAAAPGIPQPHLQVRALLRVFQISVEGEFPVFQLLKCDGLIGKIRHHLHPGLFIVLFILVCGRIVLLLVLVTAVGLLLLRRFRRFLGLLLRLLLRLLSASLALTGAAGGCSLRRAVAGLQRHRRQIYPLKRSIRHGDVRRHAVCPQ